MVENIPMNTRQIKIFVVLIFCALGFAANVNAAARKPAGNPAQQKAQAEKPQKRTYPWTIKTIDYMYNEDAANFSRYAKDNAELKKAPVAVFMGDSITDAWAKVRPNFFSENNYKIVSYGAKKLLLGNDLKVIAETYKGIRSELIKAGPLEKTDIYRIQNRINPEQQIQQKRRKTEA